MRGISTPAGAADAGVEGTGGGEAAGCRPRTDSAVLVQPRQHAVVGVERLIGVGVERRRLG